MNPTDLPSVCTKGAQPITNLPPFVYEHDDFGELTDPKGWDYFDTARTLYNTLLEAYTNKNNSLFAYILTTFQPSALSVLQNQPTFRTVVQSKNVVQPGGLLNTVYTVPWSSSPLSPYKPSLPPGDSQANPAPSSTNYSAPAHRTSLPPFKTRPSPDTSR